MVQSPASGRRPGDFRPACQPSNRCKSSRTMETLRQYYDALLEHPFINGVLPHLLTVVGFLLAFFAIARLMSQRKQPGNTFAWLFLIVFVPYVGVPLYLMFGGRKLRQLAAKKAPLSPTPTIAP